MSIMDAGSPTAMSTRSAMAKERPTAVAMHMAVHAVACVAVAETSRPG
jgi:hypothetical protein